MCIFGYIRNAYLLSGDLRVLTIVMELVKTQLPNCRFCFLLRVEG